MNQSIGTQSEEAVTSSLLLWLPQGQWKPEAFLKAAAARTGPISIEEIEASVQLVRDQRTLLTRAFEVVRASKNAPSPLKANIFQFGLLVIGAVTSGLSSWLQDSDVSSGEELRRLTEWAKPNIKSKNAACRKEAEQILGIGLILLQSKRRVAPLVVLDLIADAFSLPRAEGDNDKRPEREVDALIDKSNPRQIAVLSKVALLQDALVHSAKAQAFQDARLLVEAKKEIAELNSRLAIEDLRSTDLAQKLTELEVQHGDLQKTLQLTKDNFVRDREKVRVRATRFLGETIKQLASNAEDALEIEPPRPEFSKRFLKQLIDKIDGEITWLNAPSE